MSRDVWAIVDTVFDRDVHAHFIGHFMGSMIVQRAALSKENGHGIASLTLRCGHDGRRYFDIVSSQGKIVSPGCQYGQGAV